MVDEGLCSGLLSESHYQCGNLNKRACRPYQNFLSFIVWSVLPTHSRLNNDSRNSTRHLYGWKFLYKYFRKLCDRP